MSRASANANAVVRAAEGVRFTIPGIPPSVNHYVKHTRSGRHYKDPGAVKYRADVCLLGKKYRGVLGNGPYGVEVVLFLGKGDKLDADNAPKLILDGLVDAGVLKSDARVEGLHVYKKRDRANPRTEVWAWAL